MATENRIAYIQWIIEAIKILCDKSPIQNCLSERTRDRVGMRSGNRKALRCIPAAKGFLPDEEIHKLEFVVLFFPSRADRCRRKCLRRPCFLPEQETGERTGQRGFPLCDSPTPAGNSARSNARLPELCADSGLPARPSPMSMHTPFRSHARRCRRRRDGRHSLSVLPETG